MGQMTDGCVHLRDCARPLGLPDDVAVEDWGWGSGEEVTGPSEALAMAMTGRNAALDDLEGRGVRVLRDRTH